MRGLPLLLAGCTAPVGPWSEDPCAEPTSECAVALVQRFGVDVESFGDDSLYVALGAARDGASWEEAPLGWVLLALQEIHSGDVGTRMEVYASTAVHPDLGDDLWDHGEGGPGSAMFYELAASSIRTLSLDDDRDDVFGEVSYTGAVTLYLGVDQKTPQTLAATLLHEARHDVQSGHVRCASGRRACDDDLSGPFGIEVAYGLLRGTPEYEDVAWDAYGRVLQPAF